LQQDNEILPETFNFVTSLNNRGKIFKNTTVNATSSSIQMQESPSTTMYARGFSENECKISHVLSKSAADIEIKRRGLFLPEKQLIEPSPSKSSFSLPQHVLI